MYYQLNIDYIIETYCINTDKPQLQCKGKCHLAKKLGAIDNTDKSGNAIMGVFESFFPVFSEKPHVIEIKNLAQYYNKLSITYQTQNYSYKFEYFHFKPPIV